MPLGYSASLQSTDQQSQTTSQTANQGSKSTGPWSLINQQIATGQARLSATQTASESSGLSWYWLAGGAGILVLFYLLRRK